MVGFEGPTVSDELREFVKGGMPAGVILFARNIESTAQVAALTRELRGLWPVEGPAPLIAIDQEGGRVRRLRGPATPEVSPWPPMRELAAAGPDPKSAALQAQAVAQISGAQLASLGFNLNFAPVLDIDSNPANPVIGGRAFGADPETVAALATAYAIGLQSQGVLACGKHFPGHGDTDLDSHLALPVLPHDLKRLRAMELRPFADAAASGHFHCFMTAHIVFNALDPDAPATLSPIVIPRLLRRELGFGGVVVTDDLDMAAIDDHYSAEQIARRGLAADVDLFLVCHKLPKAAAIRDALEEAPSDRLQRSAARLTQLRNRATDHARVPWTGQVPMRSEGHELASRLGWPASDDGTS